MEVENFSRLHHQRLGPMYARLEELDAQIVEARAARTGDPEDSARPTRRGPGVMPMPGVEELFHGWMDGDGLFPEAAAMLTDQPVRPPQRVRPSEEARKLYRELARKAHPDLAQEDGRAGRREEFITRVNAAYARGDEALLRELAEEWAAGTGAGSGGPSRGRGAVRPPGVAGPAQGDARRWSPRSWRRARSARCCGWPRTTPTGSSRRSPSSSGPGRASARRSWRRLLQGAGVSRRGRRAARSGSV